MLQNHGDLLTGPIEFDEPEIEEQGGNKVFKWLFFNKIEFKVVQKQESSK